MTPARFLADTSAVVRLLRDRDVRARWQPQITAGVVGICPITELELSHSARSKLAASAELNGLTLVHYDHDFDQVAEVTGQPVIWIAHLTPPGGAPDRWAAPAALTGAARLSSSRIRTARDRPTCTPNRR